MVQTTEAGQVAVAELDINNLFEVIGKGWEAMTKLRPPSQQEKGFPYQ